MKRSPDIAKPHITGADLYYCGIVGLVVTGLIIWITEYYTGTNFRPVHSIALASVTGHGTNVIQGLAISLEAPTLPALVIIAGILVSYSLAGLFGIAIAVTTMLALAGIVGCARCVWPGDLQCRRHRRNGRFAEVEVREWTDALDAVGNTTKAVTKGYAIGSAGLGALVLFAAYNQDLKFFVAGADHHPYFQGVGLPELLARQSLRRGGSAGSAACCHTCSAAMGMTAVGRAALFDRRGSAAAVPREGRASWQVQGQARLRPRRRHAHAGAAIKEMIVPSLLPVLSPIVGYFVIYFVAGGGAQGKSAAFSALGAMLLGVIVTGLLWPDLDDFGRRGLGQRQKVHRGRTLWRQGL